MELKCLLVLAFIPLSTASPHGYGVKGGAGAMAKAEAAAGAGAFAGIPLAIPSGAGYSGSFAKSSSSSFATSSASSSASSFSFGGSGTAGANANGLSDTKGTSAGTEGCNGNCKSGNQVKPDMSGAGSNQAYSGAKAAAGTAVVAIEGPLYDKNGYKPLCSSGDCSEKSTPHCGSSSCGETKPSIQKCTTEKCEPRTQPNDTKEKCTTGQCNPYLPESTPSRDNDDIHINIANAGSKTLLNSNDQSKKYYNKPSDYEPSQLSPSAPNKPTTYLTTPKEDTPCMSPDCAPITLPSGAVYDKEKPSSYNVPILGPSYVPLAQNTVPCLSGNCKNDQPSSPSTILPSGLRGSGSICTSGNCHNYPNYQINTGSPSIPSDYKSQTPYAPAVGTSGGPKSPSYAQPIVPSNPAFANTGAAASPNAVRNYGAAKPNTAVSDKKNPSYTGGFGGPAGILKPNDFSAPNDIHVSSYKPVQSSTSISSAPCTSGNCAARPSKPEVNIPACSSGNCKGPQMPVFSNESPNIQPSSQQSGCSFGNCGLSSGSTPIQHIPPVSFKPPLSTENFAGPSGILKPNDFNKPVPKPTPSQESYNPPSFSSIYSDQTNKPLTVQYKPVGSPVCSSGNCRDQPTPPGAYNPLPLKPPTQTSSVSFGGPAGILKPNDFNKPLTTNYKPTPIAAGNYIPQYNPAGSSGSTPCSSSGCGYQPPQPQLGAASITQIYPSMCKSGKCEPQPTQTSEATTGSYNPAYCTSGNCEPNHFPRFPSTQTNPSAPGISQPEILGNYSPPGMSSSQYEQPKKPNSPQYKPAGSSGFTSCSSGDCGYQPPQHQFGSASKTQTYPTLCGSGKCEPQPTQPTKVTGAYNTVYCTSGNCRADHLPPLPSTQTNPSSPALNQPEVFGSYHSSFQSRPSSSNYSPSISPSQTHTFTGIAASDSFSPSCPSGKCNHKQPSSQHDSTDSKPASSASTYNPQLCPAGNCGLPNYSPNIPSTSPGAFSSGTCFSGNCNVNPVHEHSTPHYNQPSSANIAVGAVASAGALTYTGGFGGPPGLLKPFDGGKISSLPVGYDPKGPLGTALHGSVIQSSYGKSLTGIGSSQSGAGSQATAVAAASSYGGHNNLGGHNGQGSGQGGCTGGCGPQGEANNGLNSGLNGFGAVSAGASAKSVAGALGGGSSGTYGQAGSFATNSATAHASAAAATKGGYGKR